MSEQETKQVEKEEPTEYTEELEQIEKDHNEVEKVQDKFIYSAGSRVPKLANILKENVKPDGTSMSDEEIADKLIHDCKAFWTKETIREALPDWLKRLYEKPVEEETEDEGEEGEGAVTEEGKEADPVKAMKEELSQLRKQVRSQQGTIDRDVTKMSKLEQEILQYREQAKELKENTKLLDTVMDIYDKKLNALTFNVTGISIKRLEEWAKKVHSLEDEVQLVLKFGTKGHVLDSIG